jgi:CRP-like cAMP-binding protein
MSDTLNLIEGLTPEDDEWLRTNGKKRDMAPNERLIREGEALQEIYFVLGGLFSVGSTAGESFSTVGPGGILGDMSLLTEKAASASVTALEHGSAVLAVPRELIAAHLTADPGFAVRFYRLTATLLSERLRDLIALFITSPAIKPDTKTSPVLQGPVRLFDQTQPDFQEIERIVESLPALSQICDRLQHGISDGGALIQRVKELSVATMAAESLQLLFEVAKDEGVTDLDKRVVRHKPSLSAAEKQAILPSSLVQKTVTILMEGRFVLCSSIGDLKISRKLLSEIGVKLGLPRRKFDSYINPAAFIPEIELGLLRGMVSTFFSPGRMTQLCLVALITPSSSQLPDVAVSLSPCESVLLPCSLFPAIAQRYAERAYPYVPFTLLSVDAATSASSGPA